MNRARVPLEGRARKHCSCCLGSSKISNKHSSTRGESPWSTVIPPCPSLRTDSLRPQQSSAILELLKEQPLRAGRLLPIPPYTLPINSAHQYHLLNPNIINTMVKYLLAIIVLLLPYAAVPFHLASPPPSPSPLSSTPPFSSHLSAKAKPKASLRQLNHLETLQTSKLLDGIAAPTPVPLPPKPMSKYLKLLVNTLELADHPLLVRKFLRHPQLHAVDIEAKLDYLLHTLHLPAPTVRTMLLSHPKLFAVLFADELHSNLDYLQVSLQASKADVRLIIRANPSIMRYRRATLRRTVNWFRTSVIEPDVSAGKAAEERRETDGE